jgi:hypothetical protein
LRRRVEERESREREETTDKSEEDGGVGIRSDGATRRSDRKRQVRGRGGRGVVWRSGREETHR